MAKQVRASNPSEIRISVPTSSDLTDSQSQEPETEDRTATFWEKVASVSADQWLSTHLIYLYRGARGNAYIAKITEAIDPEWVRLNYGGGEYRAMLCGQNSKTIASLSFKVEGAPKAESAAPNQPAQSPAPNSNQGLEVLVQLMREQNAQNAQMIERVLDRLDDRPGRNDRAEKLEEVALGGVVEMFKKLMPEQKDPLALVVQLRDLMPKQPDFLEVLAKAKDAGLIGAGSNGGGGDLLSQIDKIVSVAEKLGMSAGGKSPSIAQVLAEKAPEIMQGIGSIVDRATNIARENVRANEYRFRTAVAMQGRTPPEIQAPPAPGAMPPAPGPVPGLDIDPLDGSPAPAHPGTLAPAEPQLPSGPAAMIDVVKERIVNAIAKGAHGGTIVDFIDVMDDRLTATFEGWSEEKLTTFFEQDAILQNATKFPRFKDAIREMVAVLAGEEIQGDTEGLVQ